MNQHSSLETPGGLIRAQREAEGISLAEMSERTKIPPPVLEAIERDEYHKVSGALYIKSFLRTCAVEIGLDAEVVLSLYGNFSGENKSVTGGPEMVWEEEEVQISRIEPPWRDIALVGVVVALVGVGLLLLARGCGDGNLDDGAGTPPAISTEPAPEAPTESEAEPITAETVTGVPETRLAQPMATKSSGRDTLAGAWVGREDTVQVATGTAEQTSDEPEVVPEPVARTVAPESEDQIVETEPVGLPAPVTEAPVLPLPLVGDQSLIFAGGQQRPVVLRIICDRWLKIQVKRDAEQAFVSASWPRNGGMVPPLPAVGIVAGRVYEVSGGLVVYWGADDHISLRLDRTDGVEVALNGKVRNVRNLRPGGELVLDDHGD